MKVQDSQDVEMPMPAANPKEPADLGALFDGHIEKEFADLDVNATMETMVAEPYVYCVPVMTGGFGGQGVLLCCFRLSFALDELVRCDVHTGRKEGSVVLGAVED